MTKEYPSSVHFLLAEDVRLETGGQFTIVGVYAGDGISLDIGEHPGKRLLKLTLLIIVRDGHGHFNCRTEIFSPSNSLIHHNEIGVMEKNKDENSVVISTMNGFPVKEFGGYTAKLSLDDKTYEYQFKITNEGIKDIFPK